MQREYCGEYWVLLSAHLDERERLCVVTSLGLSGCFPQVCVASLTISRAPPTMQVTKPQPRLLYPSQALFPRIFPSQPHARSLQFTYRPISAHALNHGSTRNRLSHTTSHAYTQRQSVLRRATVNFHTSATVSMSDADYEAFLNKANEDTSGGQVKAQAQDFGTKSVNTTVPAELKNVDEIYTSEADEAFEPVALNFSGDELSARKSTLSLRRSHARFIRIGSERGRG